MDYKSKLADRAQHLNSSAISELLTTLSMPGMIAMSAGSPAPEAFPINFIREINDVVIDKYGSQLFQYGITEGFKPLRKALVKLLINRFFDVNWENICVSTGAQTAIDAAGKILINQGDKVGVEAPTYLAALQTFRAYEPEFVSIEMDENGIIPESLEKAIVQDKIKLAYIIPNFQNPSGRTLSLERRKQIAGIIKSHDALVIEDDPYFELRYIGEHIPPIKNFAPDNVIYIVSLSKIFCPGMRLGYYIAPKPFAELMTSTRQGVDVHANNYAQALAAEYIDGGYLDAHLSGIIDIYKPRLKLILDELEQNIPGEFTWSKPDGGMFIWIEGPEGFDANVAYKKGIARKIAFVPGNTFFVDESVGINTMRLNFTNVSEEEIKEGVKQISEIIKDMVI